LIKSLLSNGFGSITWGISNDDFGGGY
jgi:hypothetical protein